MTPVSKSAQPASAEKPLPAEFDEPALRSLLEEGKKAGHVQLSQVAQAASDLGLSPTR